MADALILQRVGFDAVLMENYGDIPFHAERVESYVISEMTAIATAIGKALTIPFGVQVLRNDSIAGLSIGAATGAAFIRVNVHTGSMITDQGIIRGKAAETLRARAMIDTSVKIFADVMVKHAQPFPGVTIESSARDAVQRGCADAVIVSGAGTGEKTSTKDIARVRSVVHAPVYVGSGATAGNAREFLEHADGIIVGTSIKAGCITSAAVDAERAEEFVRVSKR